MVKSRKPGLVFVPRWEFLDLHGNLIGKNSYTGDKDKRFE